MGRSVVRKLSRGEKRAFQAEFSGLHKGLSKENEAFWDVTFWFSLTHKDNQATEERDEEGEPD